MDYVLASFFAMACMVLQFHDEEEFADFVSEQVTALAVAIDCSSVAVASSVAAT